MSINIEDSLPVVKYNGLNTVKNVDFSGASTILLSAGTTIGGSSLTALGAITSTSANAFSVGRQGTTNPAFNVDASASTQLDGLNVTGLGVGNGSGVSVITSGTNSPLTIDAAGSGTITLGGVSTGRVIVGGGTSHSPLGVSSTSATAFVVSANGTVTTNPIFTVDASTGSAVTGLSVKGAVTTGTVAVAVTQTAGNANLTVDAKGTGTVGINTVGSTSGLVTIGNTTSLAGAFINGPLTYSEKVLASSGNTTITAAMSGATMLFDGSSVTYTLPAGVVGMNYTFLSSVVSATTQKIITTTGDFFTGTITVSTAAGTPATYMAVGNGTTHLAITQNGTTTGGGVGSIVTVVCYAANKWNAFGQVIGTGSNTTPFATS